jgi:hypothetical protein
MAYGNTQAAWALYGMKTGAGQAAYYSPPSISTNPMSSSGQPKIWTPGFSGQEYGTGLGARGAGWYSPPPQLTLPGRVGRRRRRASYTRRQRRGSSRGNTTRYQSRRPSRR